jgi:hypothetical protein
VHPAETDWEEVHPEEGGLEEVDPLEVLVLLAVLGFGRRGITSVVVVVPMVGDCEVGWEVAWLVAVWEMAEVVAEASSFLTTTVSYILIPIPLLQNPGLVRYHVDTFLPVGQSSNSCISPPLALLFLSSPTQPLTAHTMSETPFQRPPQPKELSRKEFVRPQRKSYARSAWDKCKGRDVPSIDGIPIKPPPGPQPHAPNRILPLYHILGGREREREREREEKLTMKQTSITAPP